MRTKLKPTTGKQRLAGKRFRLGVHEALSDDEPVYVGREYGDGADDQGIMQDIIREYNAAVAKRLECSMVMSVFEICPGHHSGQA